MSKVLEAIKTTVQNGVEVQVTGAASYGKFPVTVRDTTNSVTSGWELLYRISQSNYNSKAYDTHGHFSEVKIANFNNLYGLIQQVYGQFKQGVNVEQKYDTNFAVYQPNEQLWFTALEKKAGTSITITVTDEASPFHMMSLNFFITMSKQNNQPYMIGYDSQFDQNTNTYTEKLNAFMLPRKKRYVPVYKQDSGVSTIKANGMMNQQGLVQIDETQTDVVYIQEIGNERKLLAGIYEKAIIELVLDKTNEHLESGQSAPQLNNAGANQTANNMLANTPFSNQPAQQNNALGHTPNSFGWTGNQAQQQQNPNNNVFNAGLQANTSSAF